MDVRQKDSSLSDSALDGLQVEEADLRNPKQKVILADSLYGNHIFLAVFLVVKHTNALVRLRSKQVFYGQPKTNLKGNRGCQPNTERSSSTPNRVYTF